MGNKELLLAYINTLNERDCTKLYLVLRDEIQNNDKYVYFNDKGERVNGGGLVVLGKKQLQKLLAIWDTKKVKQIISLQARVNEAKKDRTCLDKRSDYHKMITWTERYYYKLIHFGEIEGIGREEDCLNFSTQITLENAKKFYNMIPSDVRDDDSYCLWLFNKFGEKLIK